MCCRSGALRRSQAQKGGKKESQEGGEVNARVHGRSCIKKKIHATGRNNWWAEGHTCGCRWGQQRCMAYVCAISARGVRGGVRVGCRRRFRRRLPSCPRPSPVLPAGLNGPGTVMGGPQELHLGRNATPQRVCLGGGVGEGGKGLNPQLILGACCPPSRIHHLGSCQNIHEETPLQEDGPDQASHAGRRPGAASLAPAHGGW